MPLVLGVETSCDETSVAVVNERREILHHAIYSQIEEHKKYKGVVPEIAARAHLVRLKELLNNVSVPLSEVDAFAATTGPGLIGGLNVGVMAAKSLSYTLNKPFLAINHLEGHALTPRLTNNVAFPYLLLLVSGGHSQIVWVKGLGQYRVLGSTIDDAVGEAFDKTAKVLGLPHPGGVALEKLAKTGDAAQYALPRPLCSKGDLRFSFSGLKTAVLKITEKPDFTPDRKPHLAASFQETAANVLAYKIKQAMLLLKERQEAPTSLVIAGGVGANQTVREKLQKVATDYGWQFVAPPPKLCTDNGAMIAWAGVERLMAGKVSELSFKPTPRWPLGECVL